MLYEVITFMATPHSDRHRSIWLFLSILYVVLFSFPLLQTFNRNTLVFGIPLLVLYLVITSYSIHYTKLYESPRSSRALRRKPPASGAAISSSPSTARRSMPSTNCLV